MGLAGGRGLAGALATCSLHAGEDRLALLASRVREALEDALAEQRLGQLIARPWVVDRDFADDHRRLGLADELGGEVIRHDLVVSEPGVGSDLEDGLGPVTRRLELAGEELQDELAHALVVLAVVPEDTVTDFLFGCRRHGGVSFPLY